MTFLLKSFQRMESQIQQPAVPTTTFQPQPAIMMPMQPSASTPNQQIAYRKILRGLAVS